VILCVTPNPALDRTLLLPQLRRGEVLRPSEVIVAAGGKGLNVARSLRALGSPVRCAGPLGGHNGRLFAELAVREGLDGVWTWAEGETRICTILVESAGESTGIYERGQALTPAVWERFCDDMLRAAQEASAICLCGSLPPGVPPGRYAAAIAALRATGVHVWVDTSGPALEAALAARPGAIKVNAEEAAALLSTPIADVPAALAAAVAIRARDVATVVITLGRAGAVLLDADGAWLATPPPIQVVSAVGSGDAFLAGLLHASAKGASSAEALRYAVATGAANAAAPGVARFTEQDVAELLVATSLGPASVLSLRTHRRDRV
jgi:1-phosphofructokinase family hexose kinase